jgi:hypothetical protein
MTMRLESAGLYELSDVDYFADPCPKPSLTQSIAKTLLTRSPMHAAWEHPRLNPVFELNTDKKFDLGNIAHALLLGRGRDFALVDAEDWRTKAAREDRERAIKSGKIPVLTKLLKTAEEMVDVAREQLRACSVTWAEGRDVKSEATIVWQEDDIWLRSKLDRLVFTKRGATVMDYKTTGISAAEDAMSARIYDQGWDIQAAMHARGLASLYPLMAGCTTHLFIVQETFKPYALSVVEMPESVMTGGAKRLQRAIDTWTDCLKANRWPSYATTVRQLHYPDWALRRLEMDTMATEAAE